MTRVAETESADAQFDAVALNVISKLERERDEYKKLVRLLQEENERLKRGLLGQKAERLPSNDAQKLAANVFRRVLLSPSS